MYRLDMEKQISQSEENDQILSFMLSEEIKKAREKNSLKNVCIDLGVEWN